MNEAESLSWDWDLRDKGLNMLENFTPLAVQAASSLVGDIFGEARPDKGSRNISPGRLDTFSR